MAEIQKKGQQFGYEVKERKVHFARAIGARNQKLAKGLGRYLYGANPLSVLTAPIIWSCVVPAILMDVMVSFYQFVCFPIYGIPKVERRDYIVLDRGHLSYLNFMEKWNCFYCGYFNGLVAYAQEIAARTEQNWCPIKHALRLKAMHSRYRFFLEYGDAEGYRARLEKVRLDFDDLKKKS